MATRKDLANAIRALSMDAVQKANSGHPGAPMGMAEIAEELWNHHLSHNPKNPNWSTPKSLHSCETAKMSPPGSCCWATHVAK